MNFDGWDIHLNGWDTLAVFIVAVFTMIVASVWIVSNNKRRVEVARVKYAATPPAKAVPIIKPVPQEVPSFEHLITEEKGKHRAPKRTRAPKMAMLNMDSGEIIDATEQFGEHPDEAINQTGVWAPGR